MRLFLLLLFCSGCGALWGSQPTRVEPLPIKVGGLKDSSIEFAIPIKTVKKKHGGYRSPLEVRGTILLTSPDDVPFPIKPTGLRLGIRSRW
jgi:hypothetical protein